MTCAPAKDKRGFLTLVRNQIKSQFRDSDPVERLRGEWHFKYLGKDRSLKVEDNHVFYDSEFGKGDIQHVNGDRYRLTYYANHDLYGQLECEVIFQAVDGDSLETTIMEREGYFPCRFGRISRVH